MFEQIKTEMFKDLGLSHADARQLLNRIRTDTNDLSPPDAWEIISQNILTLNIPFEIHALLYDTVFGRWQDGPPPAWRPSKKDIDRSNIHRFAKTIGVSIEALYDWSLDRRETFWSSIIDVLGVKFRKRPSAILGRPNDAAQPDWLHGARINIAESCFQAKQSATAIVYQKEGETLAKISYAELDRLSNRVANSLLKIGVNQGAAVAIAMPMTVEAVAAYIGIVKAGCVVVSIADSFAPDEIATRLSIANTKCVVTQDVVHRIGKTLPMYQKVVDAGAERAIVIPASTMLDVTLRADDILWDDFLVEADAFDAVACDPSDAANILFSSGTTGDPKAIPWTHTTPIKCAMDGYLHQNIHMGDVVAWPTNLGWMMGPWLIFASLINRATIALYYGAPNTSEFCRFVETSKVTMLGVVPSLVKAWRVADMTKDSDWRSIDVFSSTGEASNAEDMLYLMSRAGYRPVIEYCGGTEIGGGYVTGSVVKAASPATFSIPTYGLGLHVLDEDGKATANGEVFLTPPSIGLSTELLNKDHREVYYADTPPGPSGEQLRRHGDQIECLEGGFYRAHGRADDTMNLGGIKTSSAEIERTVNQLGGVTETAAIAVAPDGGGPSRLVIYTVLERDASQEPDQLKQSMQRIISKRLNPLFRVYDVVVLDALPRTASNKVMRRVLRGQYGSTS